MEGRREGGGKEDREKMKGGRGKGVVQVEAHRTRGSPDNEVGLSLHNHYLHYITRDGPAPLHHRQTAAHITTHTHTHTLKEKNTAYLSNRR